MNEKLARALSYVDEAYISAAARRKKRLRRLPAAIAAVLALVIFWNTPTLPLAVTAKAVSLADDSRKMARPNINSDRFDLWFAQRQQRQALTADATPALNAFSAACSREVLAGAEGENRVWSPINAYIALAMASELTGSHTRQALWELLGVSDAAALRSRISALWETVHEDNGKEISVLANSLWLDKSVSYRQDIMEILSYDYYASVYQGSLGSSRTNRAITNWLNNQTGGFLKDRTGQVSLTPNSVLALVSTLYFQSQWDTEFSKSHSAAGTFHAAGGDISCTFMHDRLRKMSYYWAADYGAVCLGLKNGSSMWLILPDADKTVEDVLQSQDYAALLAGTAPGENRKRMLVNLSVPRFDVSAGTDLKQPLSRLGLEALFQPFGNDFSPSMDTDFPVYLEGIRQDTRVAIDEEGVTAASYILLDFGASAAEPPDEIIDFVLDRPFLFAVCKDNIPLFVGTVQQP